MSVLNQTALWNICDPMREDGLHISTYIDQLSALLFLKACDSSSKVTFDKLDEEDDLYLSEGYRWENLYESEDKLNLYNEIISELQDDGELARKSFEKFSPQFEDEETFKTVVENIEKLEGWENLEDNADLFGDAYEYLMERYAEKGSGEYFTPRPLVQSMVKVTDPEPGETIIDPASGTNKFLIDTYFHLQEKHNIENSPIHSVEKNLSSRELTKETYRMGLMNYMLHNINPLLVDAMRGDSLQEEDPPSRRYDIVLANPPFGSTISYEYDSRCDSKIESQFLAMMMNLLDDGGRAAIVVPEGILFDRNKRILREELLEHHDLDCILTLPENAFQPYADVKANVLFFEKDSSGTEDFWYYDARTDFENIKKSNPLDYEKHLSDFVENWGSREESEYYFKVNAENVDEDNYELHLKKYKELKYEGHRPPNEIAQDIKDELYTIENTLDQLISDTQ